MSRKIKTVYFTQQLVLNDRNALNSMEQLSPTFDHDGKPQTTLTAERDGVLVDMPELGELFTVPWPLVKRVHWEREEPAAAPAKGGR